MRTSPTGGCYASEDTRTSEPSSSHSTLGPAFGELIVVLLLLKEIARQGNIPIYAVNTLQVSLVLTSAFINYKRSQNCCPTAATGLRRIKCRLHLSVCLAETFTSVPGRIRTCDRRIKSPRSYVVARTSGTSHLTDLQRFGLPQEFAVSSAY